MSIDPAFFHEAISLEFFECFFVEVLRSEKVAENGIWLLEKKGESSNNDTGGRIFGICGYGIRERVLRTRSVLVECINKEIKK